MNSPKSENTVNIFGSKEDGFTVEAKDCRGNWFTVGTFGSMEFAKSKASSLC